MATAQEKTELIQALRFTPRDIDIQLLGYGGEIVMGTVTAEQYNFWQGREDFEDAVWDWDHKLPPGTAEDLRFCEPGNWHDCDDIAHECSMEMSSSCVIRVTEVESNTGIWESTADITALQDHGVTVEWHNSSIEREDYAGRYLFVGQSIEKGSFGSYRIRITQPFDPRRLRINVLEVDGWCLCGSIEYDGQEGENQGDYDTSGKGSYFHLHYEPEAQHQLSDWHDAVSTYPAHDGVYDIEIADTVRRAWWVNSAWREQTGEKISAVERWRGLERLADSPEKS